MGMTGRIGWAGLVAVAALAAPPSARAQNVLGHPVFGPTKMWDFHVTLSAKEHEAMQPAGAGIFGGGGFGAPAPKAPAKKADPDREAHRSVFNMEFPIARGQFTAEGKTYADVAFRYKGNGSYLPSAGKLKRNLKVELDRYAPDQRFRGQKTLNLNAGAADPTKLREALAYAIYRDAGVPAPRTAFAAVTLTVPGKYDQE